MKKVFLLTFLLSFTFTVKAQSFLSLDSCRALALANNKDLLISNEKISAAHYQRKAAFTNYLPNFSATGAYMRNQKEFSLLNNDQKAALSGLGTNLAGPIQQAATEIATAHPDLAPLISSLSGKLGAVLPALDQAGNSLVDALRTDTRNIYAGAITLTQPLYMGGKIRAYNKITKYAEELAQEQHHGGMQEVIMSTDQAYWQVISLVNKKKLAEGYLKLLQQLDSDVEKMINEGVATKADGLSVRVKVNEAEMTLTKVEDGLSLARMLLCQLCGIDLSSPITLADENMEDIPLLTTDPHFDLSTAYENRPEIRSLELATQIYKQKVNVTRAEHLPSIALMGNYMVTNPSVFNSFENKFKGMWNVGVMVQIPIWHWGEGIYKTRAAKAEARIAQYQLQDAREKIELQVNQAAFKVKEAGKKLVMSSKNMEKAEENLRYATLGFKEGVIATSNVTDARIAMQEGKIYGFFYLPKGLSAEAQSQRQPTISFYTNYSYLIAGSLLFRDMKMMGELTSGAAARTMLYAKGATEDQAMAYLQPIVIDTHPLNNPWLNYSVYLCNTLIPGVLMLLIFMVTVYSIGVEIKDRTAREWLRMSNNSIYIALAGKLLPHTIVFFIMGIFYNVYLYGFLHFPCNSGIFPMIFATLCLVLASQCCGIVMIGTLPTLRLGLSFASLWGVISFSISGFSFPVMAMHPVLQALSNLFPLRHYFLIYVDQALNGYSMAYSWTNYMALLIFMMLPFFVVHRLKEALVYYKYIP